MSFLVDLDRVRIKTTIATTREQVNESIQALMINSKNRKRLIGLDTIQCSSNGVILQLCDANQCFIFRLSSICDISQSLRNFLSLPSFTFVGFGIQDALAGLEKQYGLVCKNFFEVRPSVWYNSRPYLTNELFSMHIPSIDTIASYLDIRDNLTEDMIKLAVSNSLAAFHIGDRLIESPL